MSQATRIQWCDSTVNPTMGCDGCELWGAGRRTCYAGVLHQRFGGGNPGYAPTFEEVTLFPGRMEQAARWSDLSMTCRPTKPWLNMSRRLIFISDMSDALSAQISFAFLRSEIIANVASAEGRRHRWLWLTKRPGRMAKFAEWLDARGIRWPENLSPGTSITTQATTTRIDDLLRVGDESTRRFVSIEPQVEEIDVRPWLPRLHWVIQGGESGHGARPFDVRWSHVMRTLCSQANVPYFLKQLGSHCVEADKHGNMRRLSYVDPHGGDWCEWPRNLRVRENIA